MTALQQIQLEILEALLRVCGQRHLRCYAIGGTLLGAVRHQGFIPWDDDIDVIMPREDYDKLIDLGSDAFNEPFHLQSPLTESGFWRSHLQVRKTGTVGCIPDDVKRPCGKGVFIDIFVLDGLPPPGFRRALHLIKLRVMNKIGYLAMDANCGNFQCHGFVDRILMRSLSFLWRAVDLKHLFRRFCKVAAEYPLAESDISAHTTFKFFAGKEWRREWFGEPVLLPFESIRIPCPPQSEQILKKQYGEDCLEMPKQLPPSHGDVITTLEELK